jgi:hypothetical protein
MSAAEARVRWLPKEAALAATFVSFGLVAA